MESGFEGFDLSVFDLCQTYNLTILVESWPTCTNRKKKSEAASEAEISDKGYKR